MENARRIGVSPAYFISGYGFDFGPDDIARHLPHIALLGCVGFEVEVPDEAHLASWVDGGARRVGEGARASGLAVHQCVLHYLLNAQSTPMWTDRVDYGLLADVVASVVEFTDCRVIAVPVAPLDESLTAELAGFVARVADLLSSGVTVSVEPLPNASIATPDGFARFRASAGGRVALCLDTGNIASGNDLIDVVRRVGGASIADVHACDTASGAGTSLAPGTGVIDWVELLDALDEVGYSGPLDLEIIADPTELDIVYSGALAALRNIAPRTPRREQCLNTR